MGAIILLTAGVVWHFLIILYIFYLSPTLSVDLEDEHRTGSLSD